MEFSFPWCIIWFVLAHNANVSRYTALLLEETSLRGSILQLWKIQDVWCCVKCVRSDKDLLVGPLNFSGGRRCAQASGLHSGYPAGGGELCLPIHAFICKQAVIGTVQSQLHTAMCHPRVAPPAYSAML